MTSTHMAFPPDSPLGRATLPAIAVTLGVLYALTRAAGTPPLLTAGFGVLGVAYLPGLAASLWMENRFGLWASWVLPLILSPLIVVAAAWLLLRGGIPLASAPSWIVFISVLGVALAPQPQRELEDWTVSTEVPGFLRLPPDRQQMIGVATVVLVLIAIPLLAQEWIRAAGDAAYHVAAARRVVVTGIPPDDPLLAGVPLRYFWAFHVYLALLTGATRVGVDVLLAGGSLAAAFVIGFTGYRLLTLLALSHARALWGSLFLFFGLNGLYWLWLPGRVLAAGGSAPFLDRLLGRLAAGVGVGGFPTADTFFLEQFLTTGPFVVALAYLLVFNMAAVTTLGENRLRWNFLVFMSALGMLVFHPGVGAVALAVTAISIPVVWIAARLNPFRGPGYELTGTLAPMALALLVAAPYIGFILRAAPFEPARYLDLNPQKTLVFAAVLLPELGLGLAVMTRFLGAPEVRRQAWTVWAVLLLTVTLVVGFAGSRSVLEPLLLAHVPLGLAAGASIPSLWQRFGTRGRTVLVVLLLLVLGSRTGLGVASYLRSEDPRDLRPRTHAAAAWIRGGTPPEAILVDVRPDLAFAARRALLYGDEFHLRTLGYDRNTLTTRRIAHARLVTGMDLDRAQRERLRRLRTPVFVVHRQPRPASQPLSRGLVEVFRNEGYALYRLDLEEAEAGPAPGDTAPPRP